MNKKTKKIFFCMIFAVSSAFAQKNSVNYPFGTPDHAIKTPSKHGYQQLLFKTTPNTTIAPVNGPISLATPGYKLAPNFYTQNFGFFCKKELQVEKLTKLPLKFRLGSMQEVDRMEGKPNAVRAN